MWRDVHGAGSSSGLLIQLPETFGGRMGLLVQNDGEDNEGSKHGRKGYWTSWLGLAAIGFLRSGAETCGCYME